MRSEDARQIFLGFVVTITVNSIAFLGGIFTNASYYTPGNPTRPNSFFIDVLGILGAYIGVSQLIYLIPATIFLIRLRRRNWLLGLSFGGIATVVISCLFLLTIR